MKKYALKNSIKNVRINNPQDKRKPVDHISSEGLVTKISEEIFQLTNQNANNLIKIC